MLFARQFKCMGQYAADHKQHVTGICINLILKHVVERH
jgi:hypothetical protein